MLIAMLFITAKTPGTIQMSINWGMHTPVCCSLTMGLNSAMRGNHSDLPRLGRESEPPDAEDGTVRDFTYMKCPQKGDA